MVIDQNACTGGSPALSKVQDVIVVAGERLLACFARPISAVMPGLLLARRRS
jgi:hypothetical protein